MKWNLQLTAVQVDETLRIAIEGRLSAATASRLASRLAEAIDTGNHCILLDLKGLDYISSGGLMALEAAAARLHSEGGWLRLEDAQPAVRVALDLAGLEQLERPPVQP